MSIEETNKLRAKLGLAPLDVNDKSKSADKNSGQEANEGEVFVEDGMQYVHKAAEHIGDKKRAEEMREKLQVHFIKIFWSSLCSFISKDNKMVP